MRFQCFAFLGLLSSPGVLANVKAGLTAKAAGGKILKVESLTKNGKMVAYEAKLETAGKKSEIQVGPDGKPLDHEEQERYGQPGGLTLATPEAARVGA